jgi:flagella basal body P-ring formation protein FlgA
LIDIPKERLQYSVSTNTFTSFFNDRNISVVDTSEGVVVFKKDCLLMGKAEALEALFLKKFQAAAPYALIETKPRISTKTSLPSDFQRYRLVDILLNENMLRKNNGSFTAVFKVGDKERKLYFAYDMDAKARVFKAKRNLPNGTILSNDDFETVFVNLDTVPSRAFLRALDQQFVAKNMIREGQILTDYLLEIKHLVSRKESIKAIYKDQGLVIEVQATLLEDGDLGDVVKIKTEQGKILNAKIISSREAVIAE